METTKNAMPEYTNMFFNKLKNYLDTKIYFFGSVQREDYFPKQSDIDVAIFTDNIKRTLSQLKNFLQIDSSELHNIVWRLNVDDSLVNGYKVMYKEPERNLVVEISIYDETFKHGILSEYNGKRELPSVVICLLMIIKYFHYSLSIIPNEWYTYLKRFVLSTVIFLKEDDFVVF